jgi:hypothetical protein
MVMAPIKASLFADDPAALAIDVMVEMHMMYLRHFS